MSQRQVRYNVGRALSDSPVVPLGDAKAQEQGGSSIYVPYPQPHARNQGIEQSSEVELALLAGTGVIMVAPSGFDWEMLEKQGEPFTAGQ
ncbi:hypothetical protein IL252_13725 [Halomicrobium sp. IBSBa]|uniref:hypothetical protein n=1 Tax=Halomicrobium sp. IBSBa TaxID=2778916 RepID=UPI001ABF2898|nr:hypothetical protein [Halomicrobium sp. IBSBa]MBO4248878.1 hypothetical protein [Halomicrobium sp. IBSBa]